jgi:hypothetical protein
MTEAQIILIFALGALFGACAALAWANWELRRKSRRRRNISDPRLYWTINPSSVIAP